MWGSDVLTLPAKQEFDYLELNTICRMGGESVLVEELIKQCEELLRESRFVAAVEVCDKALEMRVSKEDRCRLLLLKAEAVVAEDGKWGGPALVCLRDALQFAGDDIELRAKALVGCVAARIVWANWVGFSQIP